MMENLFNCLCSLLLHVPNRDRFLKGEGLQLMNLMLRYVVRDRASCQLKKTFEGKHKTQETKNKTREFLGRTEEKSVSPTKGH